MFNKRYTQIKFNRCGQIYQDRAQLTTTGYWKMVVKLNKRNRMMCDLRKGFRFWRSWARLNAKERLSRTHIVNRKLWPTKFVNTKIKNKAKTKQKRKQKILTNENHQKNEATNRTALCGGYAETEPRTWQNFLFCADFHNTAAIKFGASNIQTYTALHCTA